MSGDRIDIKDFCNELGINMTVKQIYSRSDIPKNTFSKDSSHWECRLARGINEYRIHMVINFSMGSAHKNPPQRDDVMNCLIMDACTFKNADSFEDWAMDLGYDEDPPVSALRIYKQIKKQVSQLEIFLEDSFEDIWSIEPL